MQQQVTIQASDERQTATAPEPKTYGQMDWHELSAERSRLMRQKNALHSEMRAIDEQVRAVDAEAKRAMQDLVAAKGAW